MFLFSFVQVRRLESAIREEEESLRDKDAAAATGGKKRGRDSEDAGDSNGSDLIRDVEKLREMNVRQLRDEAVRRGIDSTGSKKELLKRICEDCEKEKEEETEDKTDGISNYVLTGVIFYTAKNQLRLFPSYLFIGVSRLVSEPKHVIPLEAYAAKLVVSS